MLGLNALKGIKPQQLSRLPGLGASVDLLGLRYFAAAPNNMALIKQLREQTGAPIADVKSALQQADWDLEKASQELRKKGLAAASKKASRHAAEGLVGIATNPTAAAIIEINSETDFVARNDQFKQLVSSAAAALLHNTDSTTAARASTAEIPTATLEATRMDSTSTATTVGEAVADVAGSVRENIKLRRGYYVTVPSDSSGTIGSYIHGGIAPGLGRIASLVLLQHKEQLTGDAARHIQDLAHKLAMHVVGAVPKYLDRSQVPQAALEAEKKLLTEQAAQSGKPQNIIEKMVQGRLSKFYEEVCLLEQPFIMDDKKKVKDVVKEAAGKTINSLELVAYLRVQVGEGLEEEGGKKDFAAEVAETLEAATK